MLKLKRTDQDCTYHGFNLKPGFWYGVDTEDQTPIATSGWEVNGCVGIYRLEDEGGEWKIYWYDIEATDFELETENLPEILDTSGKKSFREWLEDDYGISYHDWDENYGGVQAEQISREYDRYCYDGLPEFVIKNL